MLLIKIMNLKMVFSTDLFIKSILLNSTQLIDLNMEMDVILNMKLLFFVVINVLYHLKVIVLLNVLLS